MRRYVLRRLASVLIVLWGVTALSFALGQLAPGDPAEQRLVATLGREPTGTELAAKRREMGLDRPLAVRYGDWLSGVVRGDLGESLRTGDRVSSLLWERLPRTALLALTALIVALVVALPLGVIAARWRNSVADHGLRAFALLGASLPSFFLGYLLMFLFGVRLGVLPVSGFTSPRHLVLPAVTLAAGLAASLTRLTRASLLEVLGEDHVRTAWAKGLSANEVYFCHGLRTALIPLLTIGGLALGYLLSGVVIVETVFSWPGMGQLAVNAIHARDYPLIQGFTLFSGVLAVGLNLVTDMAYVWADPRVRLAGRDH